jgi:hypothetical protein
MLRHKPIIICLVFIVAVVGMFVSFTTTVVPVWKLRVIDINGTPCPNSQVNQGWGHYSLELESPIGGSEYRLTDSNGYVEFPERTIKATLFWRIIGPIIAFVMQFAHGSFGISGNVFTTGMVDGPWINYKPAKPLPDTIVVDRCYPRSN